MMEFLFKINLCVFVYGFVAISINWYLKKRIITLDILSAFSFIAITMWHPSFILGIGGAILTFLECFYRNEISFYLQRKLISYYNKKRWGKYLYNSKELFK
jgi:hypothetical protein